MKLDGVGVTQASPFRPYRVRLKFDNKYLTVELERGQEQNEVAKRLRELADQVEKLS